MISRSQEGGQEANCKKKLLKSLKEGNGMMNIYSLNKYLKAKVVKFTLKFCICSAICCCICICSCIWPTCDCCDCCDRLNGIIGGNLIVGSGNTVSGQTTSGHHTLLILPRSDFYQPLLYRVCNRTHLILMYTDLLLVPYFFELNYSTECALLWT